LSNPARCAVRPDLRDPLCERLRRGHHVDHWAARPYRESHRVNGRIAIRLRPNEQSASQTACFSLSHKPWPRLSAADLGLFLYKCSRSGGRVGLRALCATSWFMHRHVWANTRSCRAPDVTRPRGAVQTRTGFDRGARCGLELAHERGTRRRTRADIADATTATAGLLPARTPALGPSAGRLPGPARLRRDRLITPRRPRPRLWRPTSATAAITGCPRLAVGCANATSVPTLADHDGWASRRHPLPASF